jgi:hypothetical protein
VRNARRERPAQSGFIALIPDEAKESIGEIVSKFSESLKAARVAALNARTLALEAKELHDQGTLLRAKMLREQSAADHRRSCDHLADAAHQVKRAMRCAALDWRPSLDCQGTGLTVTELVDVCGAFGREDGAKRER